MESATINFLPSKYEDIIITLLNINPKFVLGGSLALHILDIMDYDFSGTRIPDVDLGINNSLTEEELVVIRDFFNLEFKISTGDYDVIPKSDVPESVIKPISHFLTKELIQLHKGKITNAGFEEIYKIDIFNGQHIQIRDIVYVKYKDYELRLTHPSIILAHKSKYAYDVRVQKQYKHFNDIQKINWDKYFKIVKNIQVDYSKMNFDIKELETVKSMYPNPNMTSTKETIDSLKKTYIYGELISINN